MAHAGDTIRVDRMGRDAIQIDHPALSLVLTVQRSVVQGFAANRDFRGKGLLALMVFSLPTELIGRRLIEPPETPAHLLEAYSRTIAAILDLRAGEDEFGHPAPHLLTLSVPARAVFTEFRVWVEDELRPDGGRFEQLQDWGSKLPGLVLRIAGDLHLAICAHANDNTPWGTLIGGDTMARAIKIGRYAADHAEKAFDLMGADPVVEDAKRVLARIKHRKWEQFSKRDLHRACRWIKQVKDLDGPLAILTSHHYMRERAAPPGVAHRHSEIYDVHPDLRDKCDKWAYSGTPSGSSVRFVTPFGGDKENNEPAANEPADPDCEHDPDRWWTPDRGLTYRCRECHPSSHEGVGGCLVCGGDLRGDGADPYCPEHVAA